MSGRRVQRTGLGTETVAARVGVRPHRVLVGPEALTFVSLFDDTVDVWADEDFGLLDPLSRGAPRVTEETESAADGC